MHLSILETREYLWSDEAACEAFAKRLSRQPDLFNACIELHGGLGAGKTTFVRHLLRALGVSGRIKSPSYAVLESYELPQGIASHFDFYRFSDPREWEDAGFREIFTSPGLKLCEWPEKAEGMLPEPELSVFIETIADEVRRVRIEAHTSTGQALLQGLDAL
ncbi:MAG: tRNA (adenosine(37)-N6)-threonylcarbamoyltransferase complex ATPase subunit type 1 TsaE [Burkholderiaceae bacterium]|nr:tRNA (adenosine(37)-N6)-threonylcarbamoyltransferase complex ATPase subunit type 1 TsaE [Burkholderiaceae bacterium]